MPENIIVIILMINKLDKPFVPDRQEFLLMLENSEMKMWSRNMK